MRTPLLLSGLALLLAGSVQAQCDAGQTQVTVSIVTDAFGNETSWELTGPNGAPVYATGGPYAQHGTNQNPTIGEYPQPEVTACVPNGSVIVFTINDAYGDGMNGGYGEGSWTVSASGHDLATGGSFGGSQSATLAIGGTDMGLVAVDLGYRYLIQEDHSISGTVANFSDMPINGFTLTYSVDQGAPVSQDFTATVPVGGTYDFTFTTPWNAPVGSHDIEVSVATVTGGDLIAANNSADDGRKVVEAVTDRTTLIEEFTSSTCFPCQNFNAGFDPIMTTLQTNVPGSHVSAVKYQMNWPSPGNDPSYNPDGNSRRGYYGISSIPYPLIDGKEMMYGTADEVNDNEAQPSPVSLDVSYTLNGTTVTVTAHVTPLASSLTGTHKLHLAVTEDHYHYTASVTAQDDYHYAMRKMLPNASGNTLQPLVMGETQTVTQTYTLVEGAPAQGNYNLWGTVQGITVVAFVQHVTSKEVLQSAVSEGAVGIDEATDNELLSIYPNPSTGLVYLTYGHTTNAQVKVMNMLGEEVVRTNRNLNAGQVSTLDLGKLNNGVYMVSITADGVRSTQRVMVNH